MESERAGFGKMLWVKVAGQRSFILGNLNAFVNYVHGKILSLCRELLGPLEYTIFCSVFIEIRIQHI